MITATCRTCHKDWTMEGLPAGFPTVFMALVVLEAPCGHGRYVGEPAFPPAITGLREMIAGSGYDIPATEKALIAIMNGYKWEWQDTAFDQAKTAWEKWYKDNPQPEIEPWNPPPLTMTCACGTSVTLAGERDSEDLAEGWMGKCPNCELSIDVWDSEKKQPYTQERDATYKRAYRGWSRKQPQRPDALFVTSLRETESEEHP